MSATATANKFDKTISKKIYDLFNSNKVLKEMPHYLGLLPYEVYVLPGMYISILQMIWLNSSNPVQLHLLPHLFAYSLFGMLKGSIKRPRPGCSVKSMSNYINASHCTGSTKLQSFPSSHAGVGFALATALYLEMMHSENSVFFEMKIKSPAARKALAMTGFLVAIMVTLHRVSKGYHHLGDCVVGAIIGSIVGYVSWKSVNVYRQKYGDACKEDDKAKRISACNEYRQPRGIKEQLMSSIFDDEGQVRVGNVLTKAVLSVIVMYLLHHFVTKDLLNLSAVKH